jgi:hypothetical protein
MIRVIAWIDRNAVAVLAILLTICAVLFAAGCADRTPDDPPPVPAQIEAERLGRLAEDDALIAAAATAEADALDRQSIAATSAVEAARLKTEADAARMRAAIADARAGAARQLRQEAEARAVSQRAEVQTLAERAAEAAANLEAEKAMQRDRRWAGIGIGGCIAAAIALLICRIPPALAIGGPAAAAAGLLWIVGWSSVPWLAHALGLSIAGFLLIAVALLLAYVVREWRRHADDVQDLGREEADRRSIARQPSIVRPLISWLLGAA